MRKTLIALMFATALPTVAMAMPQDGPGPGPDFGGPRHEMGADRGEGKRGPDPFERLDLTREQRQQIGKLMGDDRRDDHEIVRKYLDKLPAAEKKAMQDEMKADKEKTQAQIRALLNPEQQKQFDEMKKKQEQRRAEWAEFQAWKASKAKAQ